jgi:leukotriene-A4 hydrolase
MVINKRLFRSLQNVCGVGENSFIVNIMTTNILITIAIVFISFNVKFLIDHYHHTMTTTTYPQTSPFDKNSFANSNQVKVEHYDIHWRADFSSKKLIGNVVAHARIVQENPSTLVLDARSIDISSVSLNDKPLKFHQPTDNERQREGYPQAYGYPLIIELDNTGTSLNANDLIQIKVEYTTTENSEAVQWLSPEQTIGKKHPFLFTQAEPIHARSMLPCQDTPSVKATVSATITVDTPLVAVMNAIKIGTEQQDGHTIFKFEQKVPIPTYLISLIVGELKGKQIGPRSTLWSEQEILDEGAYEFANTEKFIAAAEEFLPAYAWGTYDLIILPPSFAYGGMEGTTTTVSPTLLAGDRSLENVIAHEIAHSWSGNLVTNKNWESFWLNEGFTVYIERRIIARLSGEAEADLHALLGYYHLVESLEMYDAQKKPELTKMVPDLTKVDPDDAFSSLPYEKGFNFLYYLAKQIVGNTEKFEEFLKSYFSKFASQSITADDMKNYFINYFTPTVSADKLNSIEWDKWFFSEGYPVVKNEFDSSKADAAKQLAQKWINNESDKTQVSLAEWSSNQICLFLDTLLEQEALSHQVVDELEEAYKFTERKNMEIRFRFLMIALKSNYEKYYPAAAKLATEQGRMKFTRPLFRALNKATNGRDIAVQAFTKHRNELQLICSKMVAKDLELQ